MTTARQQAKLENLFPLTPGQEGIFFHALYTPESAAYLNQLTVRIDGTLDPERLRQAWRQTVARHDSLRSCFRWESLDKPLQLVVRELDPVWHDVELPDASADQVEKWLAADRDQGLALTRPGVHRVSLLRLAPTRWMFVLTIHHLVIDGWSMGVLFKDFFRAYREPDQTAASPAGYHSYAAWVTAQDEDVVQGFWEREFEGFQGCTYFGLDRGMSAADWRTGFSDGEINLTLDAEHTAALESWARRERVTPSSIYHAAFALVLHRFTGSRDVLYGATCSGRPAELAGVDGIVGNLVNILPLRLRIDDGMSTAAWIRHVQQRIADVLAVQHSSLAQVQRWSGLPPSEPLFSTTVTVENYPFDRSLGTPESQLRLSEAKAFDRTIYPFNLTFIPGESLRLRFTIDTSRFTAADIRRIGEDLIALLRAMTQPDAGDRGTAELMSATWEAAAAPDEAPVADAEPVLAGFAARVRRAGDAVAARQGDAAITFAELDAEASAISRALRSRGVAGGSRVAVQLRRTPALLAAVIGVMRAGAAVVPVDDRHDARRTERLLRRSGAELLITEPGSAGAGAAHPSVDVDTLRGAGDGAAAESENAPAVTDPDAVACLLLTSGASGEDRVIEVSHRALANQARAVAGSAASGGDGADRDGGGAPLYEPVGSAATVAMLLGHLVAGRALHLVPGERGIEEVIDLLAGGRSFEEVAVTPQALRRLVAAGGERRLAGEVGRLVVHAGPAPREVLAAWRALAPRSTVELRYGPPRAPHCCALEIPAGAELTARLPVGRPAPGTALRVLDDRGSPVVDGAIGSLYVGGGLLADERAESDEPNGAATGPAGLPGRWCRTGDRVRLLPDGDLTLEGRLDEEQEVAGRRVDLAALARLLRESPEVEDAAVALRQDPDTGAERLVAYLRTGAGCEWPGFAARLVDELGPALPPGLDAGAFVQVPAVPRRADGRVDVERLPDASREPAVTEAAIAPRDAIELRLAVIWKELLELDTVDVRGEFFDLGGHSILAVRMMAHIKKEFGRELPLTALLEDGGTLESIAELLRTGDDVAWSHLVPIQTAGPARPSFWVHAAGGNVLSYAVIAEHLGPDFPMYGLQARGLDAGQEPVQSVVEMARSYVEAIRQHQPHGPYTIAGWSFGGMAAVEICRQLMAAGEEIAELVMVDTGTNDSPPRTMDPTDPVFLSGLAQYVSNGEVSGLSPAELGAVPAEERVNHVVDLALRAGSLPPGFEPDDLYRFLAVYAACNDAYRLYEPRQLPPRTTLIRAEQNPDPDPQLGWSALTSGRLRVIDAPGNHVSVMASENVAVFAPSLAKALQEAAEWEAPAAGTAAGDA